ncbi:MAG: hypothetical protein RBR32_03710 [Bacteroidales bacterium]|nr:hypothetical protein [Bacteroidales bacterium]
MNSLNLLIGETITFFKQKELSPQEMIVICKTIADMMNNVITMEGIMMSMTNLLNNYK